MVASSRSRFEIHNDNFINKILWSLPAEVELRYTTIILLTTPEHTKGLNIKKISSRLLVHSYSSQFIIHSSQLRAHSSQFTSITANWIQTHDMENRLAGWRKLSLTKKCRLQVNSFLSRTIQGYCAHVFRKLSSQCLHRCENTTTCKHVCTWIYSIAAAHAHTQRWSFGTHIIAQRIPHTERR